MDDVGDPASTAVPAQDLSVRSAAFAPGPWFGPWKSKLRRAGSVASVVAALTCSVLGGRAVHDWVTHTPRFAARDIVVTGLTHTSRDQVLAAAHLAVDTNVLGLDTRRVERNLRELPWIESVRVIRRLPGSVRIELRERIAVAVVSAGGLYLATADGLLFKRAGSDDPSDLPVITGIDRADFERDADLAREGVRDALALLADVDGSALAARVHVDEVHRDATGDLSMVLAEGGTYVWLGRGPYRAKMARLSAILAELAAQHITPAEIHLESDRHPERATVRVHVPEDALARLPSAEPLPPASAAGAQARAASARTARGTEGLRTNESTDEAPRIVRTRRHRIRTPR